MHAPELSFFVESLWVNCVFVPAILAHASKCLASSKPNNGSWHWGHNFFFFDIVTTISEQKLGF